MSEPTPIDAARIVRETFVAAVESHEELGSTNDLAAERAAEPGVAIPLLIVARRQTAGRGRGANRWWTGRGGLAMSLLLPPDAVAADRNQSPLVALGAAVAVAEAVVPLLPGRQTGIHWPNDVAADGRKLGGVLVEVLADRHVVVGVGLNTNNTLAEAPEDLQRRAASLRDLTGRTIDHTALVIDLLIRLEQQLQWLAQRPQAVAERAGALLLDRGRMLTVRAGGRRLAGRCLGIAPDGALVLQTEAGTQNVHSAVVESRGG
jgi:BirA family biotin operon repressor/biotin-[acetyl-CoA-carboxylase] ligase